MRGFVWVCECLCVWEGCARQLFTWVLSRVQCGFNKHSVSMWSLNNHINIVITKKVLDVPSIHPAIVYLIHWWQREQAGLSQLALGERRGTPRTRHGASRVLIIWKSGRTSSWDLKWSLYVDTQMSMCVLRNYSWQSDLAAMSCWPNPADVLIISGCDWVSLCFSWLWIRIPLVLWCNAKKEENIRNHLPSIWERLRGYFQSVETLSTNTLGKTWKKIRQFASLSGNGHI